jgi:hypothetical protein
LDLTIGCRKHKRSRFSSFPHLWLRRMSSKKPRKKAAAQDREDDGRAPKVSAETVNLAVLSALGYIESLGLSIKGIIESESLLVGGGMDGQPARDVGEEWARGVSEDVRARLSVPAIVAVMSIVMRLHRFALMAVDAADEGRPVPVFKPRTHLDFTLNNIWNRWKRVAEAYEATQGEWNEAASGRVFNPYNNLCYGLKKLENRLWHKHFM